MYNIHYFVTMASNLSFVIGCLLLVSDMTSGFVLPTWRMPTGFPLQRPVVTSLVEGTRNFSCTLLNHLVDPHPSINSFQPDANVFFSPLGVSSALAMLRLAAGGQTRNDLNNLVLFRQTADVDDAFRSLYNLVMTSPVGGRDKVGNNELLNSNAIFVDYSLPIYRSFLAAAQAYYSADIRSFDFKHYPEESRHVINQWVSDATQGHIRQLLSPDDVTVNTEIVLANTIFFLGQWKYAFNQLLTRPDSFMLQDGTSVQIQMMQQTARYRHRVSCSRQNNLRICNNLNAPDVIELPFKGERRQMVILFPNERISLREVEQRFSSQISHWRRGLSFGDVSLRIPKFRLEYEIDLKRALENQGLRSVFNERVSDFGGMTYKRISISKFVHRASMVLEETGMTSSAATGAIGKFRSFFPSTNVTINRPFMFFIEDIHTGAIVFLGRVTDPR